MSLGKYNEGIGTATRIKKYAAGGVRNLVADEPNGMCARQIQLLTAGDLTSVKNHLDQEMGPITGLPAGIIEGSFSEVNCTADFIAFF
jgi:hypothetical protein